jgi:hypothetical protein
MTARLESVTVPRMVPVSNWHHAVNGRTIENKRMTFELVRIVAELLFSFIQAHCSATAGPDIVTPFSPGFGHQDLQLALPAIKQYTSVFLRCSFDLVDDGGRFPTQPGVEHFADAVRRQPPQAESSASLEDL